MGAAEHIELETWELFMAVMESGSYLQSARAMNVDPSTVSRRLRKLEDRLRMQLFYRESTGLRPTEAGCRVMNQMHDVLTDILAVRDGLAKSVSGVRGRIRVSIPEPIQTDAVWEVMSQLEFENTGLRLDLEPPGSGDDPAGLAFQVSPMIPTGSRPVSLLPLVCVASPGYLAEHGMPESPEALTEHTLIFSELSSYSRRFTFSRGTETISVPLGTGPVRRTPRQAICGAQAGSGIAIGVPYCITKDLIRERKLIPIPSDWLMPPLQVSVTVHALQHSKYLLFYLAEEIRKRFEAISSEEQKALEKLAEKVKHGKK